VNRRIVGGIVGGIVAATVVVVATTTIVLGGSTITQPKRPTLTAARQAGGVVFDDANGNGVIDKSDRVVRNVRVTVTNPVAGTAADAVVRRDGSFLVDMGALPSVLVTVAFDLPAPPGGQRPVPVRVERRVEVGYVADIAIRPNARACASLVVCEGLLLPDLVSLPQTPAFLREEVRREYPGPSEWTIDRTTAPGRVLLRVATISANIGAGPLLIVGTNEREGTFRATKQRLMDANASYFDIDSGTFEQSASHGHVHLQAFEEIRLLDDKGTVAKARKISFCLTDVFPAVENVPSPRAVSLELKLFECGKGQQGMNTGMADYYGPALADQFVDITGIAPGRYTLEIVSDPGGVLVESNETNNSVQLAIELTAEQLR
jgi:Lysyl oxidase